MNYVTTPPQPITVSLLALSRHLPLTDHGPSQNIRDLCNLSLSQHVKVFKLVRYLAVFSCQLGLTNIGVVSNELFIAHDVYGWLDHLNWDVELLEMV